MRFFLINQRVKNKSNRLTLIIRHSNMHTTSLRSISPQLIIWCAFAAVGGVCSWVLPAYLAEGGLLHPAYGWPLIPWFASATANLHVIASMVCFLALGFSLGMAQPRRWLLLAVVGMALPAALNAINIAHDWRRDATSHHLFPFEFLLDAFVCLPALVGAWLGFLYRRMFLRLQTET